MSVLDRAYQKAREQLIPLAVHFDLTYRCHQRCVHCYIPESWRRGEGPGPELTTVQVKNILDQLAAAGAFFLTFSGGEMFLRPDILPILEHARNLNFSISLLSSGTVGLDEEQVEALADIGLAHLLFSMYSVDPAVHDRITGVPGSCAKLIRTIKACRARDLQVVLNCFIFRHNHNGIMTLKEFANQHELHLRLSYDFSPSWDGKPAPADLLMGEEEIRRLIESQVLREKKEPLENITTFSQVEDQGCAAGSGLCYISPQGEVWPCVEVRLRAGYLSQQQDFSRIWEGADALKWVRQIKTGPAADTRLCDYYREKGQQDWHLYLKNKGEA